MSLESDYEQRGESCPRDGDGIHREVYWQVYGWYCTKCHFILRLGIWYKSLIEANNSWENKNG